MTKRKRIDFANFNVIRGNRTDEHGMSLKNPRPFVRPKNPKPWPVHFKKEYIEILDNGYHAYFLIRILEKQMTTNNSAFQKNMKNRALGGVLRSNFHVMGTMCVRVDKVARGNGVARWMKDYMATISDLLHNISETHKAFSLLSDCEASPKTREKEAEIFHTFALQLHGIFSVFENGQPPIGIDNQDLLVNNRRSATRYFELYCSK